MPRIHKPRKTGSSLIRPIHIRHLARRAEFGNVSRVTSDPRLYQLVRKTILEYAEGIIEKMIEMRTASQSKKVSFDDSDVRSATT